MRTIKQTASGWRLVLLLLLVCLATAPILFAQNMDKSAYYDYLIRSGQVQVRDHAAGPMLLVSPKGDNQKAPGDVKLSTMDVGNVRARFRNTGTLGYDRDGFCFEFPFNSGLTYRWTMGPMIAAKDMTGRKMVSGAAYGAVRGTTEDSFRPLGGFDGDVYDISTNLGIAFSDKPASWPSSWPTVASMKARNGSQVLHSNAEANFMANANFDPVATATAKLGSDGFPGVADGEIRAAREAYYVVTDNDPQEPATPLPMDIRVDVWALQWDDFLNRNFIIYKLLFTNIGDETLKDVYVGIHDDPDAPEQGSNEWTDDYGYLVPPGLDENGDNIPDAGADPRSDVDNDGVYTDADRLLWNFFYLWDGDDQSSGFIPNNVGWVGLKFLETPNDPVSGKPKGVTSLDIFQYSAAPNTDTPGYDQMAGVLHVGLAEDDPQQGGGTPIMLPDHPDGAEDDIFGIKNSYGPDVTVTAASGPYNLDPGESLPFTFASVHGTTQSDVLNNATLTQLLYNNNYAGAKGPPTPNVVAVPGDKRVTLYWDDTAERGIYPDGSFGDPLTGNNAFEGYKIFRSDDGGQTFGQAIRDIKGTVQGYIPLAIYDLPNLITGESETRRFFDLGSDSGLRHSFVDTDVDNGKEYLYAVVAYDHQDGPVIPLETPINVANPNDPGDNTVLVRPAAKVAGVVAGEADQQALHTSGTSDVDAINIEVVDPSALVTGTYQITFGGSAPDKSEQQSRIATRDEKQALIDQPGKASNEKAVPGYTVSMNGSVVSDMSGNPVADVALYDSGSDAAPIFNGMRAFVEDVAFGVKDHSQTVGDGLGDPQVINADDFGGWGNPACLAADYEIRFIGGMRTYVDYWDGGPTMAPFEIFNITTGTQVHAETREPDGVTPGVWEPDERIYIVDVPYPANEEDAGQWLASFPDEYCYRVWFESPLTYNPGDTYQIISNKPLTSADIYEFDVQGPEFDTAQLEDDLEEVTVVPNPFIVSSSYEKGAYGIAKELQFHQLPDKCTIKIYNTAGELVQLIDHDGGSIESWNMQTYNGQEVSFGVYLYLLETEDGMEKTGKFAIIK